jgi:hypothetical protein
MSALNETVYLGRNNAIRLQLSEDGVDFYTAYPDVTPTRWILIIHTAAEIVVDSLVEPAAFDWTAETSTLELRLGNIFTEVMGYTITSLVVYSAYWPDGVVWVNPTCTPDTLKIRVCNIPVIT